MENKKVKIVSIISIIALVITVIGATFAYFVAQTGEGKSTDIKINANTVDTFTFETGSALSLNLNQDNFASGAGNQSGTTYAKAMLTANNKTNTATEHYYLYLNITENTFTYTQDANTPEILLAIKDANDNAITNVTGLTYKTVTDGKGASISGFDITTKSGLITLFDNREITTTSSKTEQWNITVTFVNYNADQSKNAGNTFSGKVLIQKEEYKQTLAEYVISQYTGTQGENGIYYHNSSLTNGAVDNSYRYAGGDYVLTDAGKATGATTMIDETITTALIDFYCDGTKQYVGYVCDGLFKTSYYLVKGETTRYQTYDEALNASIEKGYLIKDNVKNFVCFGTDASPCPTDNLYRIIGVFGENYHGVSGKRLVKIIKYDYANSNLLGTDGDYASSITPDARNYKGSLSSINIYYWNYKATDESLNTWSTGLLNKTNLNTNFINNIGGTWANKIATTTWKVGGNTDANIGDVMPSTAYQNEILIPDPTLSADNATEYRAKIGLMYASDYGFAADPSAWTTSLYNYAESGNGAKIRTQNWMYMGLNEWTITRNSDTSDSAFSVDVEGSVITEYASIDNYGIRPSFNLASSVPYVSGEGTQSNPIIIN